ncbi:MAG: hypothetical protein BGO90_04135 [Legionella sp. 40-6]|nr:MAG: hypothetical protein BGO90_04135 [Legionella sp. 40-6]
MTQITDILIIGAGPVGLMCAYLARCCGLHTVVIDSSDGPLKQGRADALNARTLQLLELVDLFSTLYSLGKPCNTSAIWTNGRFISRQSSWWEELEGCFHKHFLMLGQAYIEQLLDKKLQQMDAPVLRATTAETITPGQNSCITILTNGNRIHSKYIIGADGAHSFVRNYFKIPFHIMRPQLTWVVIDGVIQTTFPKVPEIIVFQAQTSDVAWIPREGALDRFYVRMDTPNFSLSQVLAKINRAITPHTLTFEKIVWYSQFSVKESVAENFGTQERIFLAGDACHVHSVNGGQGLNTGLADAFNLIWKLKMIIHDHASPNLLHSYEKERKPIAERVIKTSGALVRATKFSSNNTHAQDYVRLIAHHAGYITGMGIRYGTEGLPGTRIFDCTIFKDQTETRLYTLLSYQQFTLLIFGDIELSLSLPRFVKLIHIYPQKRGESFWTDRTAYCNQAVLVRPDSYIESTAPAAQADFLLTQLNNKLVYKPI